MALMTQKLIDGLPALYSNETNPDPLVYCKFFNPGGAGTWYVTEGEVQPDGDILFFGLIDLQEQELGYFMLSELEAIRVSPIPGLEPMLPLERDLYLGKCHLNDIRGAL